MDGHRRPKGAPLEEHAHVNRVDRVPLDQNINGRRTYVARLEKDQSLMRLDQLLIGKWLTTLFSCFRFPC